MENKEKALQASVKNHTEEFAVFHGKSPDGKIHFVGITALKVVILKDGSNWFAQGLDLDYGCSGTSIENAKKNFENGLMATIQLHIQAYNTIVKMLKPAPPEVWQDTLYACIVAPEGAVKSKYCQCSIHSLDGTQIKEFAKFSQIEYYVEEAELQAA